MIAVIADDFTGAAEIAGIALRHGFRVVMDTKVHANVDTDVLVIATDSRSKNSAEAKVLIAEVTASLLALRPKLIFKKTDSLLRGNVGDELVTQMMTSGKKRALLIPANPLLKRTIKDGIYYADGVPLNESHLADASRNKIATSEVLSLIGESFRQFARVIALNDNMPDTGIIIGNTMTEADLDKWANRVDADTIAAGSGGFFNAIIKNAAKSVNGRMHDTIETGKKIIYVCGSAFPQSKAYVSQARASGRFVSYMPENMFTSSEWREKIIIDWAGEILAGLEEFDQVILAIDQLQCSDASEEPNQIKLVMASVVEKVMHHAKVNELVIEGGATASSIIEKLRYERFFPAQELAQGVIRMKVEENPGLFLTLKPGSYQWPASIWIKSEYIL